MKKAQILSALALAFALGVAVIPTASTYAYVVGTNKDGKEVTITASETITDLNKAIDDAEDVEDYDEYKGLVELVNGDAGITVGSNDPATLNEVKDAQKAAMLAQLKNVDTNAWSNKSYDEIYKEAVSQRKKLQDTQNGTTTSDYTNLNKAITDAETNVSLYEEQAVADIQKYLQDNFDYKGNYMVNTFVTTDKDGKTVVDYSGALTYAKNQVSRYAYFSTLVAAVSAAKDVLKAEDEEGEKYTENQAIAALTTLQNAIAGKTTGGDGTGNGTNDGDNKPGQSAPDTGILANAEGSASTTVAMVAGIATALTAAGAGVVAYRNARRSTRK